MLDSESELDIRQSIDALRGRLAVVTIAHRLLTIRNVDEVIVFDRDRFVERGSYEALRDRKDWRFGAVVALPAL